MATNTSQMTEREGRAASTATQAQKGEPALRPLVDIYENGEGITLKADMPGVSKERLNLRIDGDTLLIEGSVEFELPEKIEALYADVRSTTYRRSFVLSRELQSDKIEAVLKDGVLTVRIPKRAELRPRKIEVNAA